MLEEYFEKNKDRIDKLIRESKYPLTAKLLDRFYSKNSSISNVIQSVTENDDYVVFILFRSFIEHFIVNLYIWLKFTIDQNDETAKKYYNDYCTQETLKRLRYNKQNNVDYDPFEKTLNSIIEYLTKNGIITQKSTEKLNISANQFDIRKIAKFILKNLPENQPTFFNKEKIKYMLDYYNHLSSNIHGGPWSDLVFYEYKGKYVTDEIQHIKKLCKGSLAIHRFYILYFLAHEFSDIKTDIITEMDKYDNENNIE